MKSIVLSSGSLRRAALLRQLRLPFQVWRPPDEPEPKTTCPQRAVEALARHKARAGHAAHPDRVVLAADTVVCVDGERLGKPATPEIAAAMLERLSGGWHCVLTGVCVLDGCGRRVRELVASEETRVQMTPLTAQQIEHYVASGEPADKAGAYGIQGLAAAFISRIEGCYTNVVGLPLALTTRLLAEVGIDVTADWGRP